MLVGCADAGAATATPASIRTMENFFIIELLREHTTAERDRSPALSAANRHCGMMES